MKQWCDASPAKGSKLTVENWQCWCHTKLKVVLQKFTRGVNGHIPFQVSIQKDLLVCMCMIQLVKTHPPEWNPNGLPILGKGKVSNYATWFIVKLWPPHTWMKPFHLTTGRVEAATWKTGQVLSLLLVLDNQAFCSACVSEFRIMIRFWKNRGELWDPQWTLLLLQGSKIFLSRNWCDGPILHSGSG